MPTSSCETISPMTRFMQEANPRSILDVGSGFGKYGLLAREYLEIGQGRDYPDQWTILIDAVEIWAPYGAYPAYNAYYDHFYNKNILDFIKDMKEYDLIICGDVIEHLEKLIALQTVSHLLEKCKFLLFSLPLGYWPVSDPGPNVYEKHISTWEIEDLNTMPFVSYQLIGDRPIAVGLLKGKGRVTK